MESVSPTSLPLAVVMYAVVWLPVSVIQACRYETCSTSWAARWATATGM